jgi:hypothetical protein
MEAVIQVAERSPLGVVLHAFWHAFKEGAAEIVNRPSAISLLLVAAAVFLGCAIAVVAVFGLGGQP